MTYFNTNNLEGEVLASAEIGAGRQEDRVLELFRQNKDTAMTPETVHQVAFPSSAPLTSARRALSVLAKKGYLVKIPGAHYPGSFGKPIHAWRLK